VKRKNSDNVYLLIEKGNSDCEKAIRILENQGINFNSIDVDEQGIRKSMWRDFRTTEVPILLMEDLVISGFSSIEIHFTNGRLSKD